MTFNKPKILSQFEDIEIKDIYAWNDSSFAITKETNNIYFWGRNTDFNYLIDDKLLKCYFWPVLLFNGTNIPNELFLNYTENYGTPLVETLECKYILIFSKFSKFRSFKGYSLYEKYASQSRSKINRIRYGIGKRTKRY